jgi:hyperosmotically inducible protein
MQPLTRSLIVLALALVAVVTASCTGLTGKTAGENLDDATITAKVKTELAREQLGTLTRIDVDTDRGVVALNGVVDTASLRLRAADVARQVRGVREVVNNLQVKAQ